MDLEATFQQFCRTREPAALGAIFDATADDLFGLALHLTRDHAMAEDVLQATFLVAIQRAEHWQPDRPLRPWLLGILHREVKTARRRARRALLPERLVTRDQEAPAAALLAGELRDAVLVALGALPEPYRQVVGLHLLQDLTPAAIATRLERSSGSVRTQLWRGLDLLRQRLPQGLALGLTATMLAHSSLAAVRQRVIAASAGAVAVPVAAALMVGGMMKKVLAVAGLLVVGLLVVVQRTLDATPRPTNTADEVLAVAALALPGGESPGGAPDAALDRQLPAGAAAGSAPPPVVAAAAPVEFLVRVLDLSGAAIADAEVELLLPKLTVLPTGQWNSPQDRSACVLREQRTSDALGRVRFLLEAPALLSARKSGIGWSGDRLVQPDRLRPDRELLLVLQPTGILRGVVQRADGRPVEGATVEARLLHAPELAGLPPASTDADGRFEFEGLAGTRTLLDHHVGASLGAEHSRPQKVRLAAGEVREIVLRFRGEFVVRGTLVDERGSPCAGRVLVQGLPGTAAAEGAVNGRCGDDGRFELPLDLAGEYRVVGGRVGASPAVAAFAVDAARPAAQVTLRMQPLEPTSGRVVDGHGAPLAGRVVAIEPELSATSSEQGDTAAMLLQLQRQMLEGVLHATSDGDGRFLVRVPPGWRCRVITAALPGNRELWVRSDPFVAPSAAVSLVVREQDTLGFVLAGRVVDAADGQPVLEAGIERRTGEQQSGSMESLGRARDGSFRLGPLAPSGRCWFVFTAEGYARTIVGPFDPSVRTEEVVVHMPRLGRVRCRVLRADGKPAESAFVVLQREVQDPFAPSWQGATAPDGWRTFDKVEPVPLQVLAWASREAALQQVAPTSTPVVVRPGQESEVVVLLAH